MSTADPAAQLSAAPPKPLPRCVLVANRGEIARRIFRTARDLGMRTAAVYSDADAGSPHVAEADLAVRLPGSAPADTYLHVGRILAAAETVGADCIHPGYGFLSENAEFARAVRDAGLIFVGPPPEVIAAMGSKLGAKALMAEAGVPTLPSIDATGMDEAVLSEAADSIGYPLLVKASFGGGGRGMRSVLSAEDLLEAVAGARREAESAFGNGTVFLEKLVTRPRHIEVQIFGDSYGEQVALFERECSLQRRYQKVIEEAPSPAVGAELRVRLCEAAVRAARALDYTGAGTVEFLLTAEGEFFFLEVNTRLQVEHPVTEAVTGLDLVRAQFEVAAGRPLPVTMRSAQLTGCAIEARLYAEDPAAGWRPSAGTLHDFELPAAASFGGIGIPDGPGVRLDSGVQPGSDIGVAYDPMLAKVISWAPTRSEAAALLADSLGRARLAGPTTNRDLLVRVLRSPAFLAGETDTGFFDRHGGTDPQRLAAPLADAATTRWHAVVAAVALQALRRAAATTDAGLPSGWRNNPTQHQRTTLRGPDGTDTVVSYALTRTGLSAAVDGHEVTAHLLGRPEITAAPTGSRVGLRMEIDLGCGPLSCAAQVLIADEQAYVHSVLGATAWRALDRLPEPVASIAPGSLTAPMPGTVVRVLVGRGETVSAGQVLVVLEAMKMEHPVLAPTGGVVAELPVSVREQVETGAVLAVVTEPGADPAAADP